MKPPAACQTHAQHGRRWLSKPLLRNGPNRPNQELVTNSASTDGLVRTTDADKFSLRPQDDADSRPDGRCAPCSNFAVCLPARVRNAVSPGCLRLSAGVLCCSARPPLLLGPVAGFMQPVCALPARHAADTWSMLRKYTVVRVSLCRSIASDIAEVKADIKQVSSSSATESLQQP